MLSILARLMLNEVSMSTLHVFFLTVFSLIFEKTEFSNKISIPAQNDGTYTENTPI